MKPFAFLVAASILTTAMAASRSPAIAFQLKTGRVISSSKLSISFVEKGKKNDGPDQSASGTTTLFIHGLDSSAHTWRGVQRSLATPSVAIDCRGCGRSALGDPGDFSPDALVEDVKGLVRSHALLQRDDVSSKFVLVGHSMGARIAMCYAAKYPDDVAALVIEDMDIMRRSVQSNLIQNFDEARAIAFERGFDTLESGKKELNDIGYLPSMYSKWIDEGRIHKDEEAGSKLNFWSDVNPAFRALCYRTVFDSDSGELSWKDIARNLQQKLDKDGDEMKKCAKIYLMVAGIGTVCNEGSLEEMRKGIPCDQDGKPSLLSTKLYAHGTHSIHNSAREEFMADLEQIISDSER